MGSAFDDDLSEELNKHREATAAYAAKRGFGGVLSDAAQTADDAVRAAADTITFGMLDRGLSATGLEPGAVEKTVQARERSPYATTAGDVGGALATPGMGVVGGAVSRGLGGARAGLPGMAARAGGYGVEGAGYGGAQAAGHTYDVESLPGNVGIGTVLGAAGGATTGPLARVAPVPRAAVPSTEQAFAAGVQNIDNFSAAPVHYSTNRLGLGADVVEQGLINRRINQYNAPSAFEAINLVRNPEGIGTPGSPVSIASIWQRLSDAQGKGGQEAIAAHAMKNEIAAIIADPVNATRGTPQAIRRAADEFAAGNANYAGASRANTLESAERDAARGAASTNSGFNYENKVRQATTRLTKENQARDPLMGYTPAERQSVVDLGTRSTLPNMLRYSGNLLQGGGGLGALVTGGAAAGAVGYGTQDPTMAALAAGGAIGGGAALRSMGNRAMQREVGQAADVLRQRTPLFQERAAATPGMQPGPGHGYSPTRQGVEATRKAITLELLRQQMRE